MCKEVALKLSVLDQSTVVTGRTPAESIRESIALARHTEAFGYARYWLAEHHNTDSQACTAPEILIAAIAATTNRIRVGSAGVMLPHYSALKVAEQFRTLEAIAPGRIDLGLGRAPGSDRLTAFALNPNADTAADHFPAQIRDLLAWVSGAPLADNHPFRAVRANPAGPTTPQTWILGSSDYGAQVAAYFGLPYCFAHFITDGVGAEQALALYRDQFRPSEHLAAPYAAICVWAVAADTAPEADALFSSRALWRLGRDVGRFDPLPSPQEAAAKILTDSEQRHIARLREFSLFGTPDRVATRITDLAHQLHADEVAILSTVHDPAARVRSYALLAQAFGLPSEP
jgi:luciferase family oxidoreductase group 1